MPQNPNSLPLEKAPFSNDAEYLDQEFQWLRIYVRLLEARKRLSTMHENTTDHRSTRVGSIEPVALKECQRQANELEETEKTFREILDTRLEHHRKFGTFTLGLDQVCESYTLSDQDRIALLCMTLPAVSSTMAEDVFGPLDIYNGSPRVSELMELLTASGTEDYLRLRDMFNIKAPLVRHNLVFLDFPSTVNNPTSLHHADVALTMAAFAKIVGIPGLARNDSGSANTDEEEG